VYVDFISLTFRGQVLIIVQQLGEFRCTAKAIYRVTDEGCRLAHWDAAKAAAQGESGAHVASRPSTEEDPSVSDAQSTDVKIHRRISMAEKLNTSYNAGERKMKESNTDRLRYILEEPGLRALFREFLRSNFCEENLSFWLDVQDFKRKFNITSSAVALAPSARGAALAAATNVAMEKHNESLISTAFVIYNKYLAPSSQCELNIDHGLRNELAKYLDEVVTNLTGKSFQGRMEPDLASGWNATQLQNMIRLYERIQTHVFRLMATDSVPKFIKTSKFLATRHSDEEFDPSEQDILFLTSGPAMPPGLSPQDEMGGAYMTVSQHASEQQREKQIRDPVAPSVPL
jgi:hypothetical protein